MITLGMLADRPDGPLPADTWKEEPDFEEKLGLLIEKELVFNYLRVLP